MDNLKFGMPPFRHDPPYPSAPGMERVFIPRGFSDPIKAHAACQLAILEHFRGCLWDAADLADLHFHIQREAERSEGAEAELEVGTVEWLLAREQKRAAQNLIHRVVFFDDAKTADRIVEDGEWESPTQQVVLSDPAAPDEDLAARAFARALGPPTLWPWEETGETEAEYMEREEARRRKANAEREARWWAEWEAKPDDEKREFIRVGMTNARIPKWRSSVLEIRDQATLRPAFDHVPTLPSFGWALSDDRFRMDLGDVERYRAWLEPVEERVRTKFQEGGLGALSDLARDAQHDAEKLERRMRLLLTDGEAHLARELRDSDDHDLRDACLYSLRFGHFALGTYWDGPLGQFVRQRVEEIYKEKRQRDSLLAQWSAFDNLRYRARMGMTLTFAPLFDTLFPTQEEVEAAWERNGVPLPRLLPPEKGTGDSAAPARASSTEGNRPEWLRVDEGARSGTPKTSLRRVLAFLYWAILQDPSLRGDRGSLGRLGEAWQSACGAFPNAAKVLSELRPQPKDVRKNETLGSWRTSAIALGERRNWKL